MLGKRMVYYLQLSRFNNPLLHIDKITCSLQGASSSHCSSSLLFCKCKLPSGEEKQPSQLSMFDIHQTLAGSLLRTVQSFPYGSQPKPRTF